MRGLLLAARYLTIVPVGGGRPHEQGASLGGAAPWFPAVGLGIGLVVVATERVTAWLFPMLLAALLTVTVWKLLTGGLHLDGLADCLDGLAGHDAGQRLRIMSDSRIGAFGAMGLILFLLLEIAAVAELPAPVRWRALLATPAIARATPALLARCFPAARVDGHGAAFRAGVQSRAVVLALVLAGLIAAGALGLLGLAALVVACLGTLGLGRFLTVRLGGITGDVLGAAVEAAELIVLLTVSAWTHAGR
ncbi:MAG TPA: adenosylcobinamide-GDP ribazoletransferase [Methylomirabilota bacterium]|nr:adenosylcobinamide-GDP ribazoletransferase [Methylomirabilota bacterium]